MHAWANQLLRYAPLGCYLLGVGACIAAAVWSTTAPSQNELIVLWDRSASVTAAVDGERIPAWVGELAESADTVQVVALAGRARILPGGKDALSITPSLASTLKVGDTDYANGLRLAASLPRVGATRRRILLAGDGRATRGDAIKAARGLADVARLETIALGGQPYPDAQILSLQGPGTVRSGGDSAWRVLARSTQPESCVIELFGDDNIPLARREVRLTPAVQAVPFTISLRGRGLQVVRARVSMRSPDDDAVRENDTATAGVIVTGAARVLWLGDMPPPFAMPGVTIIHHPPKRFSASALSEVGAVVLDNVTADALPIGAAGELYEAVQRGLGVLVIGGDKSLRAGGYDRPRGDDRALARLLPVRLTPRDSLAVAFAIDRSGSMGEALVGTADGTTKLSQAATAILATWQELAVGDRAGVIVFSRTAEVTLPLTRIMEGATHNRQKSVWQEKLRAVRAGGGTSLFAGITRGLDMLSGQRAKTRQVIVLTDGSTVEKSAARMPLLKKIKSRLVHEQIALTLIVVGADADRLLLASGKKIGAEIIPAATRLLVLPEVLSRTVHRDDARKNGTVGAVARHRSMRGFSPQALPTLQRYRGVGAIYAKRGAVALLTGTEGDVFAASWRLGMGRVSLIAGSPWRDWGWSSSSAKQSHARTLTTQLLTHTARLHTATAKATARRIGDTLHVSVAESAARDGEKSQLPWEARLSVAASQPKAPPAVTVSTTTNLRLPLSPTSPGVWTGTGLAPPPGIYRIDIIAPETGAVIAECPLVIDARAEYHHFGPDGQALARLAMAGGGDLVNAPAQCVPWESIPLVRGAETREISRPLLVVGILLLLSGLLIRAWR